MKSTIKEAATAPAWWHPGGTKIRLKESDLLVLEGPHLFVESPMTELCMSLQRGMWCVTWSIMHGGNNRLDENESGGCRRFTAQELLSAFGLHEYAGEDESYTQGQAADSAKPGYYVRSGRYLNIPCPGKARDGDPSISVWISDEIQDAVGKLVESALLDTFV